MINLRFFNFKSIKFRKKYGSLIHSNMFMEFSNFLSFNDKEIDILAKSIYNKLEEIILKINLKLLEFREMINNMENTDVIDSNANLELVFWVLREYGLAERFILRKIFLGKNFRGIGFTNKNGDKEYISPNISNIQETTILKFPIGDAKNQIRVVAVVHHKSFEIFPLFIDNQHNLFINKPIIDTSKDADQSQYFYRTLKKFYKIN